MNNNELTTAPNLSVYNARVDLVEVRRDAQKYPRIEATEINEAREKMYSLVFAAYLYRGQEATPSTMRFVSNSLVAEILADKTFGLKKLSWLEIGMTIRSAVLNAGKEFYGVSVATLYGALVDYAKNEGHEAERKAKQRI